MKNWNIERTDKSGTRIMFISGETKKFCEEWIKERSNNPEVNYKQVRSR